MRPICAAIGLLLCTAAAIVMRSASALAITLLVAAIISGQELDPSRIATTPDGARYVTLPRQVLGRTVERIWLSPSGDYAIALTTELPEILPSWADPTPEKAEQIHRSLEPPVYRLEYVSLVSGDSRVLLESARSLARSTSVDWVGPSGEAVVTHLRQETYAVGAANEPHVELYRVSPLSQSHIGTWPAGHTDDPERWVVSSPSLGRFALARATGRHVVRSPDGSQSVGSMTLHVTLFSSDGDELATAELTSSYPARPALDDTGELLMLSVDGRNPTVGKALDMRTGKIVDYTGSTYGGPPQFEQSAAFVLAGQVHEIQRGGQVERIHGLWLTSSDPPQDDVRRALVSTQIATGELSQSATHIVYIRDGALFACDVLPISPEQLEQMRLAQERERELQTIKVLAVAAILYSTRNDDVFPESLGDITKYLGGTDVDLSQYQYHLSDQNAMMIERPTETVMLSKRGAGGTYVAYSDSSVEWIPDPEERQ